MHHHPSHDCSSALAGEEPAQTVLGLLFDAHPGLVTADELAQRFAGSSGDLESASAEVQDGLSDLMGHGLAHRVERFFFASRAALEAQRLTI